MASGSFTISGLVSGYQTDDIIDKLVAVQSAATRPMQVQKTAIESKLTAYGSVTAKSIAFQVQAHKLADATTFDVNKATSSKSDAVSVTASADAIAGTYTVRVNALATSEQKISQGYDDFDSTTFGSGTITLGLGNATYGAITIDSSNNTLEGIAEAINDADLPVHATIINDGGASGNYHLVLTSTVSGADNTISFTNTLTGANKPTFSVLQAAQDAEVKIGDAATGVTVKSSTNSFESVIPGVSFTLLNDTDTPVTIQVKADTDTVKDRILDFIEAYNDLSDTFGTVTAYNSETKTASPLQGDTSIFLMRQSITRITTSATAISSGLSSLSAIGISLGAGGHLSVTDGAKLNAALEDDLTGVQDLFSNEDTGLARQLDDYLTTLTEAQNGELDKQQKLLRTQKGLVDESIAAKQASLERYRTSLELQFAAMEASLGRLQGQSEFLNANTAAMLAAQNQNK